MHVHHSAPAADHNKKMAAPVFRAAGLQFAPSGCSSSQAFAAPTAPHYSGSTFHRTESTMKPAALLLLALLAGAAHAGDLTIRVDDVNKAEGQVMVALYDSAGNFLKRSVQAGAAPATAGTTTVVLKDLPPGEYGIALYHDANGNGKMDRNAMGIPSEPYAFSNNALGMMGPPSFDQAKFTVPRAGTTVTVSLR
jgi:uncharacterized protein (DUF2141 family)